MNTTMPQFRSGALGYFGFVLSWSTGFWLLSAKLHPGRPPESSLIFLLGGAGPLIGAVALTHLLEPRATQRDFWRRIFDPRLLSRGNWALALLLHPALVLLAVLLDWVLGADVPAFNFPPNGVAGLLSLAFFTFWFGPLPEEIGWRGYAQDRLQVRLSALQSSVVLGLTWALWHVPLFFVPGTFQQRLGFGSPRFWIFSATLIPLSVLMTWVYNRTQRSTLSAALLHFSGNLCGALIPKTTRLAIIELILLTVAALALIPLLEGKTKEPRSRF